jgi:fatty-acyl-CoA synthase
MTDLESKAVRGEHGGWGSEESPCDRVSDALDRVATRFPDKPAFCIGEQSITYGDLCRSADQMALGLIDLGIGPGDRVAVWLSNRIEWLQLFHAVARIGAVLVPISTRFKADEARQLLAHSGASALVMADQYAGTDFVALLDEIAPGLMTRGRSDRLPAMRAVILAAASWPAAVRAVPIEQLFGVDPALQQAAVRLRERRVGVLPDDPFLIQYTSGTTGLPKGAVLSQRNFAHTGHQVGLAQGLTPEDRFFSPAPYFHVSGTMHAFVAPLAHGATVYSIERYDIELVLRTISERRCTVYHGFNFFKDFFARHEAYSGRYDLSSLRRAWTTGTEVDLRRITALGVQVCSLYGLSETTGCTTLCSSNDPLETRIGSVGRPLPGIEVRIEPRILGGPSPAPGESGEIQIRGWNLMRGYHDMPVETAAAFDAEGWFRTGDLGAIDAQGRLCFLGRIKELIRSGGENFSPLEVENLLRQHPAVADACVVGVPDERLGEVAVAMVLPRPGQAPGASVLIEHCRARIASYKVPRAIHLLESFPMTGNNKVRRFEIRALARSLHHG